MERLMPIGRFLADRLKLRIPFGCKQIIGSDDGLMAPARMVKIIDLTAVDIAWNILVQVGSQDGDDWNY